MVRLLAGITLAVLFLSFISCGGKTYLDGYNLAESQCEELTVQLVKINSQLANQADSYRRKYTDCIEKPVEEIELPCK